MGHGAPEQAGSAENTSKVNPRVSIGIPVYNGENYLSRALDSILAQSFEDFEVIISDNASTDATGDICREYATRDTRIRYFRNDTNVGSTGNFNSVFHRSRGEYFKWAAHDDILGPDFLEGCVRVLDEDSSVVLCHANPVAIDGNGEVLPDYMKEHRYAELKNAGAGETHKRFYDVACLWHACFQVFGLVRAEVLVKTPLIGSYVSADRVLLAELALYGRFHEVPEPIFFRRHSEQYCALQSAQSQTSWYDPGQPNKRVFPTYRNLVEYLGAISRATLPVSERFLCYAIMLVWIARKRRRLGREFLSVFRSLEQSSA